MIADKPQESQNYKLIFAPTDIFGSKSNKGSSTGRVATEEQDDCNFLLDNRDAQALKSNDQTIQKRNYESQTLVSRSKR